MDMIDGLQRIATKLNGKRAFLLVLVVLVLLPFEAVLATSSIARRIESFCAPLPTTPDVTSCSACHTGPRNLTDLNASGILARSSANDIQFCPSKATTPAPTPGPAPTPTPTPAPAPAPGVGSGMSGGSVGGGSGMGSGSGGSLVDDDDGEDDDDASSSTTSRAFRSLLRRLGLSNTSTRSGSRRGGDD